MRFISRILSLRLSTTPFSDKIAACVTLVSPNWGPGGWKGKASLACPLASSQLTEKEGPGALPLRNEAISPSPGCGAAGGIREVVNPVSSLLTLVISWGFSSLQGQKEMTHGVWKVDKGAGSHPATCLLRDLGQIT